jgi:hypothetical protein
MSRLYNLLAGAISLSLIAACASGPTGQNIAKEGKLALVAANLCCDSLRTAIKSPLPSEKIVLAFDAKLQAFDFGGNKAYFKLFDLPAYSHPYSIVISSHAQGWGNDLALFIPRVATYGADFEVTRYFDEKTLRSRSNNLERTIFINPSNAGERYIAVYSSDLSATIERSYSQVSASTISTGAGGFFNLYTGQDGKLSIQSSPVGQIEFEVVGLVPNKK